MRKYLLITTLAVISLVLMDFTAHAQYTEPVGNGAPGMSVGPIERRGMSNSDPFYAEVLEQDDTEYFLAYRDYLNLTDEQIQSMRENRLAFIKKQNENLGNYYIARRQLLDLLEEENPDMDAVREAVREVESYRSEITYSYIQESVLARQLLTPEQLEKLKSSEIENVEPYRAPYEQGRRRNMMHDPGTVYRKPGAGQQMPQNLQTGPPSPSEVQ